MRWLLDGLIVALLPVLELAASPASAEDVGVKRQVVLHATPARTSALVTYPEVGSRLELLDGGARRAGYLHVRLPDGPEGTLRPNAPPL